MRVFTALVLSLSLAWNASAALPVTWMNVHNQAIAAIKNRQFESAADLFRQSALLAVDYIQRGLSANDLGVSLHQLRQDPEAKTQLEISFRIWQEHPGQESRLAQTAEALAAVNRTLGDYPAAEKVLRIVLQTAPPDNDSHALLFNELGDILRETGHSSESHALFEKTLALSGLSPRRRLDATVGLADLDRDAHSWQSSFEGWNKGAEIAREQHWIALEAATVRGMGVTFLDHGEPARAEPLLRRALALFEAQEVPGHQIASTLSCLGQLYQSQGKFGMAEEVLLRAIKIDEQILGLNHPQLAVLLEMLGDAVAGRKQMAEAGEYYQRAHVIMADRFGERSPMVAAVNASWAIVEQKANHNNQAATHYEQALSVLNTAGPEAQSLRDSVMQQYLNLCKTLHRKAGVARNTFGQ